MRETRLSSWNSFMTCSRSDAFPWAEFPHKIAITTIAGRFAELRTSPACPNCEKNLSPNPWTFCARCAGIEFVQLARPDERCGFGGTFSVFAEGVSVQDGS